MMEWQQQLKENTEKAPFLFCFGREFFLLLSQVPRGLKIFERGFHI
jgi:hypothetical protein